MTSCSILNLDQFVETNSDDFPHRDAFVVSRERQGPDPFGRHHRDPRAMLPFDRERAGPDT